MSGESRPSNFYRALLAAFAPVLCLLVSSLASAEPEAPPPEWLADAELADICFLDPDRGWAVGDRGVIWRTDDGGRHWRLDESPATCPLESLSVSGGQAYAVGGYSHPYTFKSSGVVLRTREGTRRWELVKSASLPALRYVRFLDARTGWAVGNGSALYPAGVFKTEDGGRSWTTVPSGQSQGWISGDFRSSKLGSLVAPDGSVSLVAPAGIRAARLPEVGARKTRRIKLWGPLAGWLVGDGGLVLTTVDGGHNWHAPSSPLPAGTAGEVDFRALAVHDKHVWIAGTPGTCVFHSSDGGQTWDQFRTAQPLPMNALMFLDEQRGWACGALGSILATTDGGRTWRKQRDGGSRAALLGLFGDAATAPLELFARLSADEGYLGAVEILGRRATEHSSGHESRPAVRTHEAFRSLGVSACETAWQFPLGAENLKLSADTVVAKWNLAHDDQALARLEAHLVRQIRIWRPEVIVTEALERSGREGLATVVSRAVLSATEQAAAADAYPEQATVAGLAPWRVKKVICALPEGERGRLTLTTAQLAPRLGRSLADQSSLARGLLSSAFAAPPATAGFQMPINRLAAEVGERDFFSGISLAPGSEARRALGTPAAGSLDTLQRLAQRERNIRQILARSADGSGGSAGWLTQIESLTGGLSPRSAGEILFQLALHYHASGQGELAAESFELLVERHSDHALVEAALVWLMQYHTSGEAAHRGAAKKSAKAVELARRIEQTRPALHADPLVRFPLAAVQRGTSDRRFAESYYQSLLESRPRDAWRDCASGELWLAKPTTACPQRVLHCAATATRPKLDGVLDDEVWQQAKGIDLSSAEEDDATWPAHAMLAHDSEFLYIAARCFRVPRVEYAVSRETRSRDADLSDKDHIELFLDIDRDYATYYRLAVDHRGWTQEACLGDKTWNPTWFVAAGGDAAEWTFEAAIPLAELTSRPTAAGDAWAVGIQRIVPRIGFQSWTRPAAVQPRGEGFGLLLFEKASAAR